MIMLSDELLAGGSSGGGLGRDRKEAFWEELMLEISTIVFFYGSG